MHLLKDSSTETNSRFGAFQTLSNSSDMMSSFPSWFSCFELALLPPLAYNIVVALIDVAVGTFRFLRLASPASSPNVTTKCMHAFSACGLAAALGNIITETSVVPLHPCTCCSP